MMQGLTASHFATDFYPVQPGDVALVHAAAGGVGLLLTQIIRLRGGRSSAASRGRKGGRRARLAGAIMSSSTPRQVRRRGAAADRRRRRARRLRRLGPDDVPGFAGVVAPLGHVLLVRPGAGCPGPIDIMSLPKSIKIGYAVFCDHMPTPERLRARSGQFSTGSRAGKLKVRIGGVYPSPKPHRRTPTWRAGDDRQVTADPLNSRGQS